MRPMFRSLFLLSLAAAPMALAGTPATTHSRTLMCGIAGFGSCGIAMPGSGFHGYIDFHAPAPLGVRADMWAGLIESEARDGYGFILRGRVKRAVLTADSVLVGEFNRPRRAPLRHDRWIPEPRSLGLGRGQAVVVVRLAVYVEFAPGARAVDFTCHVVKSPSPRARPTL